MLVNNVKYFLYFCRGQALHIFNNPNLEILWDWSSYGSLNITGSLYIHLNPKLCYHQILPLQSMTHPRSKFTEIEVSEDNNGDQASCKYFFLSIFCNVCCVIATLLLMIISYRDTYRMSRKNSTYDKKYAVTFVVVSF